MVTGASTADLAIILIDARLGVIEQTMRHTFLASLLRIGHIVLAVNKMDLVNFDQAVYDKIVGDYMAFAKGLENLAASHADPHERAQWRQRRRS